MWLRRGSIPKCILLNDWGDFSLLGCHAVLSFPSGQTHGGLYFSRYRPRRLLLTTYILSLLILQRVRRSPYSQNPQFEEACEYAVVMRNWQQPRRKPSMSAVLPVMKSGSNSSRPSDTTLNMIDGDYHQGPGDTSEIGESVFEFSFQSERTFSFLWVKRKQSIAGTSQSLEFSRL